MRKLANPFLFLVPRLAAVAACVLLAHATARAGAFELGKAALEQGNFAEAYCQWKPLAERGHAEAQYNLGWLYANGNGLRMDARQAANWWERAAKQGHRDSQFALGLALMGGQGLERDIPQAAHWFLQAANAGHEDAQDILRKMLRENEPLIHTMLPDLLAQAWLGERSSIKVDKANLRSAPSTDADLIGQLQQGDEIVILARRKKWVQAAAKKLSSVGWIFGPLVR